MEELIHSLLKESITGGALIYLIYVVRTELSKLREEVTKLNERIQKLCSYKHDSSALYMQGSGDRGTDYGIPNYLCDTRGKRCNDVDGRTYKEWEDKEIPERGTGGNING